MLAIGLKGDDPWKPDVPTSARLSRGRNSLPLGARHPGLRRTRIHAPPRRLASRHSDRPSSHSR